MYTLQSTLLLLGILTSRVLCHDESERRNGNLRVASLSDPRTRKMEKEYKKGLDFFIMGWPKTGTSSMMAYLDSSEELKIITKVREEDAKLTEFFLGDEKDVVLLFDRIEEENLMSDEGKELQYGIKWPGGISSRGMGTESIEYLEKYNPEGTETKLLIGMRHPVRWFESFYNYRASPTETPPPSASLIGNSFHWHGVSTDRVRYEEGIMQLGNFPLRSKDEEWIQGHGHMGVVNGGTPYKVFFYLQEQLSDDDKVRHGKFLEELSAFMEVKVPFTVDNDVPDRNVDHHKRFDICDIEHDKVRKVLVENGKETAKWIRANLADADGVTLPNKEHFLEIVDTFGTDPCDDLLLDVIS